MAEVLRHAARSPAAAFSRLGRLARLDAAALGLLEQALAKATRHRAQAELQREGHPPLEQRLVLSGWAARVRILSDGRQQLLSFILPGDLIGHCLQPNPVAVSTIIALSDVEVCPAPPPGLSAALDTAYAMSAAIEEAYLLEHVARLGQFSALERVASLLLELHERLTFNGLAEGGSFCVPLTQERLADALGLSTVHVNRVLQQARRNGDLRWQGRRVTLLDPATLAARIGRVPVRVSGVRSDGQPGGGNG